MRYVLATAWVTLALWFVGLVLPVLVLACLGAVGLGILLAKADTREEG